MATPAAPKSRYAARNPERNAIYQKTYIERRRQRIATQQPYRAADQKRQKDYRNTQMTLKYNERNMSELVRSLDKQVVEIEGSPNEHVIAHLLRRLSMPQFIAVVDAFSQK